MLQISFIFATIFVEFLSGYGYYPNPSKTTLVVKAEYVHHATALFQDSGIRITTAGHSILGAAVGTPSFVDDYVAAKVEMWKEEIEALVKIAEIYPHAAYAALYIHSIKGKWQFIMRQWIMLESYSNQLKIL
jgi:hypothetical protein